MLVKQNSLQMTPPVSHKILGMSVHPTSYTEAAKLILTWAQGGASRYVCVANVHMTMEAYDDTGFQAIINQADLTVPDGMPLVWMLRRAGHHIKDRVYGPTLTLRTLEASAQQGVPVGFYGATPETLSAFVANMQNKYPALNVVYTKSPPFRDLSDEEDNDIVAQINASGARILFIGLGCPKQERWMAAHKNRIQAVMIGVGAAFAFHAGMLKQAPAWMQRSGLEWLFRLMMEPGRLWRRYAVHNPRFIWLNLITQ